ncbi:MAG: DMT family transporter [Burkholderiales bacterium]|nr:DMT family transporter [Burkholderiales bacterium]
MNLSALQIQGQPATQRRTAIGLMLAIVGAIAFSAKAIIVKLAYQYGVETTTVVAYRMIFAVPLFVLLAIWSGRGRPALRPKDWLSVCILGFFGGYLTCVLDFAGLRFVTASLERLIVYLTPTLVLMLHMLVLRRSFNRQHGWALAISYAGVVLVFGREASFVGADVAWGTALVLGSAITYAIYLTYAGEVVKKLGAIRLASLATTVAGFLCVLHFVALQPLSALVVPDEVLWLSLANGAMCTCLPVLMVMMAIERIGAPLAAQCGMAGPIATIAMSVCILNEPFTTWIAIGTALVILGIWLLARAS